MLLPPRQFAVLERQLVFEYYIQSQIFHQLLSCTSSLNATSQIVSSVIPSLRQKFQQWRRQSSRIEKLYRALSHDVTRPRVMFQNKQKVAMLVYRTNPERVEQFSYLNTTFCPSKFTWRLGTWVKTLFSCKCTCHPLLLVRTITNISDATFRRERMAMYHRPTKFQPCLKCSRQLCWWGTIPWDSAQGGYLPVLIFFSSPEVALA